MRWHYVSDSVFQHLGPEQGLPHPLVTAIAEDSQGFLWFGTQGGLARWDGYRFQTYLPNPADPYSLPNNFVQTLLSDQAGRLWIGTLSGGLAYYDPKLDRFERVALQSGGKKHNMVSALAEDGQGGLWIGGSDGLWHMQNGRLSLYEEKDGLLHNHVRSLLRDAGGSLWIGTRKGLMRLMPGESKPHPHPLPEMAVQPHVSALAMSKNGEIWVGTVDQGVWLLHGKRIEKVLERAPGASQSQPLRENISSMMEIDAHRIWFGTYGNGIIEYDRASGVSHRIRYEAALPSSLASDAVLSMWKDRQGQMWVGGFRGVSRQLPQQEAFLTLFGAQTPTMRNQQINGPDVSAVGMAQDGVVLLSLQKNGLNLLDPVKNTIEWIREGLNERGEKIPLSGIFTFSPMRNQECWIGSNLGLFHFDYAKRKIQAVPLNAGMQLQVRAILAGEGGLWLGTDAGLQYFDLQTRTLRSIAGLKNFVINAMEFSRQGDIWLGTRNNGVVRYRPSDESVQEYPPEISNPQALAAGTVASLLFDRRGRLWVATLGGGIHVLEAPEKSRQFIRLTQYPGMREMMIAKLLEDSHGDIWASTINGLLQINPQQMRARPWRRADGVHIPGYWNDSGIAGPHGELLFGGQGGLTVVRPALLPKTGTAPTPLAVTGLRLGGKPERSSHLNLGQPQTLVLQPQGNSLALEFAALDFVAPERRNYAYRLEGYDSNWVEADSKVRQASYTNLSPGVYQLRLRSGVALNGNVEEWQEWTQTLPVRVLPDWHQSWWFYLLLLLGGAAAMVALVHGRTAILRRRQQELQAQVAERTMQLQARQQQLQNANQELHGANQALNQANAHLALSVETLRQLGDIGREITANLEDSNVFQALFMHVAQMMDAPCFAIYRLNQQAAVLELVFGQEDGKTLPMSSIALQSAESNIARVAREKREMYMRTTPDSAIPGHVNGTRLMHSALFAPLMVDERVLGVMSVQSARAEAYGEREQLIFRTLSAYGAIALANAMFLKALRQAQGQLVQQEKMASLGGLVAGIAHEINTPLGTTLTGISGALHAWQSLRTDLQQGRISKQQLEEQSAEGEEYAGIALRAGKRVAELVNTFMAIAVHEAGSSHSEKVDVAQYLQELLALACVALQARGCSITLEVEAGLQAEFIQEELTEALTRVLANVADHAFADPPYASRGPANRLTLHAWQNESRQLELHIVDNGCGIASQHMPHLFEPFFTTKSGNGGHIGLGLHVAYNHVTRGLKGSIQAHSTPGEGCEVVICIPQGGG
ncbi:two-component regulator propeller domain-containing protein [Massilia sp. W12]|uniref:sensor histidine kinase n=1 Tax=Massilia sp. W12 TaxID=3126507 RepID=UPI0030CF493F